jgi:hypothetical protein
VGPDGTGTINVVGADVIVVNGNAGTFTETIELINGTDGQLLIGGGAAPAWANLTSSGGSITITNGVNSINLEAIGAGGGSWIFIEQQVASGSTSLDFVTGITGYTTYIFNYTRFTGATNVVVQTSTDGGSSWQTVGYVGGIYGWDVGTSGPIGADVSINGFLLATSTGVGPISGTGYLYGVTTVSIMFMNSMGTSSGGPAFSCGMQGSVGTGVNAFRVVNAAGGTLTTGTVTLFGLKES